MENIGCRVHAMLKRRNSSGRGRNLYAKLQIQMNGFRALYPHFELGHFSRMRTGNFWGSNFNTLREFSVLLISRGYQQRNTEWWLPKGRSLGPRRTWSETDITLRLIIHQGREPYGIIGGWTEQLRRQTFWKLTRVDWRPLRRVSLLSHWRRRWE
ncbi:hypothetical protein BJX61DRAFT_516827 [Aspergillus egyptiacus]|nr:hypothetical protein BJX61DRAFT_516827 [Aspergillus egyptiacus]